MATTVDNIQNMDSRKYVWGPEFVYIGRGTPWGNPFRMKGEHTRAEVIRRFKEYLRRRPELIQAAQIQLKDKVLVCHCHPKPCHGDILAALANGADPVEVLSNLRPEDRKPNSSEPGTDPSAGHSGQSDPQQHGATSMPRGAAGRLAIAAAIALGSVDR